MATGAIKTIGAVIRVTKPKTTSHTAILMAVLVRMTILVALSIILRKATLPRPPCTINKEEVTTTARDGGQSVIKYLIVLN